MIEKIKWLACLWNLFKG